MSRSFEHGFEVLLQHVLQDVEKATTTTTTPTTTTHPPPPPPPPPPTIATTTTTTTVTTTTTTTTLRRASNLGFLCPKTQPPPPAGMLTRSVKGGFRRRNRRGTKHRSTLIGCSGGVLVAVAAVVGGGGGCSSGGCLKKNKIVQWYYEYRTKVLNDHSGKMSGFKLCWINGTFAILMLLIPGILAWGKEGHYAVCKIAESFLTEEALKAVKTLLPETAEGDLASVCSWADQIKYRYNWRWTSELHYVDTPDFRCNYDYCRDCHDSSGVKDRCVTGAIYNYTEQLVMGYNTSNSIVHCKHPLSTVFLHYLKNGSSSSSFITDNLTEALMFLSHYIGDVHQPLHVSFTSDEGGNTITVRWYKRKTNLHHVWDTNIIESAMKTFYEKDIDVMTLAIEKNITDTWSNDISSWANCTSGQEVCPDPWASESIKYACNYAYRNATPGSTLGDDYFLSRLPVVEMRLAQGGVRLAATLNRIFDPLYSIPQRLAYIGDIQPTFHTSSALSTVVCYCN
ncbi:hypothetical protein OSB04_002351 [Centaurea solstitialis]|uniref:Aspergillus nuclease S1 n=1 Tax=Centaurea solstitialis TaxID=347529 RepID=A0AA38TSU0_9ASTR|nr:hypothetical protein OSB04_002351 [Centaurea solstitialis]